MIIGTKSLLQLRNYKDLWKQFFAESSIDVTLSLTSSFLPLSFILLQKTNWAPLSPRNWMPSSIGTFLPTYLALKLCSIRWKSFWSCVFISHLHFQIHSMKNGGILNENPRCNWLVLHSHTHSTPTTLHVLKWDKESWVWVQMRGKFVGKTDS